tara:strand:- start:738 stop:1859 length:1122 start_codon:yes stop_codon:yes gene_type:complete
MKGQWLGEYKGVLDDEISVEGSLMVNIDEHENVFRGVICITPNENKIPISIGYFVTQSKSNNQNLKIKVNSINPYTLVECEWDSIKHLYADDIFHSNNATAKFNLVDGILHIEATTEHNLIIKSQLSKPEHTIDSKIIGKDMSWSQFKVHVSSLDKDTYLFRGQKLPWKLQTSFHRRGRYCIDRFIQSDVRSLHQKLSALTSHYFDLNIPDQNGAFFNLLQHHGYPTPLLDWSYSPYVSAFFAFRDWPIQYSGNEKIRIYIFNNKLWQSSCTQAVIINPPVPHLSVMEFIAINNTRLIPQQALTTVTNIDDIEDYLLKSGKGLNVSFIEAIDIPANEREAVMQDLRYMGITAGSMFPGIDGVCEELLERNFKN